MAEKKAYEPKASVDNLSVSFPGPESGSEVNISSWPYETEDAAEQRFLEAHPQVKTAAKASGKSKKGDS